MRAISTVMISGIRTSEITTPAIASPRGREKRPMNENTAPQPYYPAGNGNPAAEYAQQGEDKAYDAHGVGAGLLYAVGLPWLWRRLRAITIGLLRPVAVGLLLAVGLLRSVAVRRLTVMILPWLPGLLLRLSGRMAGRTGRRGVGLIAHI